MSFPSVRLPSLRLPRFSPKRLLRVLQKSEKRARKRAVRADLVATYLADLQRRHGPDFPLPDPATIDWRKLPRKSAQNKHSGRMIVRATAAEKARAKWVADHLSGGSVSAAIRQLFFDAETQLLSDAKLPPDSGSPPVAQ